MGDLPFQINRLRRPTFIGRAREFLIKHKRKFILAGAVGGAALIGIGGLIGGLTTKSEEMREGNTGTLGQLIKGGGGGGGGGDGGGNSYGGGFGGYARPIARQRRSTKRRRGGKRQSKKRAPKRLNRKNGRFVGKRINKKRRKGKKRFAAF